MLFLAFMNARFWLEANRDCGASRKILELQLPHTSRTVAGAQGAVSSVVLFVLLINAGVGPLVEYSSSPTPRCVSHGCRMQSGKISNGDETMNQSISGQAPFLNDAHGNLIENIRSFHVFLPAGTKAPMQATGEISNETDMSANGARCNLQGHQRHHAEKTRTR
ncbi:hypothetical protein GE09DRAFT_241955 [Coniochaeta sp. 2T2.1]|nr:hypothetical protein GE09DRAFT_241955 [Coniochaeta sp. 2T2.1]